MLGKSSRNIQKDQNKASLFPLSNTLAQKTRSASIIGVSDLYARLNTMGLFDLDSSSSPTSPLDRKLFSNPGGPSVSSPGSPVHDGLPKNTNPNKVGLGLVDSLTDEVMPLGQVLRFSESRKVVLGSKMGIQIPGPKAHLDVLSHNPSENHRSSRQTPTDCFHIRFGQPKTQLASKIAGVQSEDDGNLDGNNHKFDIEISESETKNSTSDSPTISNDSSYEFIGSLSISDIERSENYTCIISHGPNPRTTHIFGDCILESHKDQSPDGKHKDKGDRGESSWEVKPSEEVPLHSSTDFLSYCYSCKKKLKEEDDIYIYRGEKAFCSCECRAREILTEDKIDKHMTDSSDSPGSSFHEDIFMEDDCHYMGWRIACPFPPVTE
ncbi:FCS-Like Zinc finger 10 [Elaeis guineensis]|uniref:FCS-Like Zinc finger 10 n=1 Tax=Elaeis guineensis var. tenera TaxID=51953 RepID=A0A6I9QNN9_ELAGV|nr:FCS-Like Zinc finger 10 [Elaeis guineensis]XP_010913555.1 FCS-Like Zinc finger 10 [Elaeis guineensis]